MRLAKTFAFVSLVTLVAVACGKGPAQAALTAADTAVASARVEGEMFVPEQFKALSDAAASAKAKFDSGDYKGSLETAQGIPAQAQAVIEAAGAKKTELMDSWKAMEGSLPGMVGDVQTKAMELASARRLPEGLDKAGLEAAQTALEEATTMWAEAGAAFGAGDIKAAVTKGEQVKTTVEGLMVQMGMSPAPAPEASEASEPVSQ